MTMMHESEKKLIEKQVNLAFDALRSKAAVLKKEREDLDDRMFALNARDQALEDTTTGMRSWQNMVITQIGEQTRTSKELLREAEEHKEAYLKDIENI